eukprot:m.238228 g.238228  ORF g.238228 m.238228 type:complete len:489 (+) comp19386_c0_seq1:200-1666(+)
MGEQLTFFNRTYLSIRLVLWCIVAGFALIDWFVHINEKPKGWQLHRCIVVVLMCYVLQEICTTAYVMQENSDGLYKLLIFEYNLAECAFLGLLLLISTGWCITRDHLKNRKFIFIFPPVHFICSITVDYILDKRVGHENNKQEVAVISSSNERSLLLIAYFGSIITLFYGWWWIFSCLAMETADLRKKINTPPEPDSDSATDSDDMDLHVGRPVQTERTSSGPNAGDVGEGDEWGQRINLEDDDEDVEIVSRARGGGDSGVPPSHESGDNTGTADGDEDGPGEADALGHGQSPRKKKKRTRRQRALARRGVLGEQLLDSSTTEPQDLEPIEPAEQDTADFGGSMPDRAKLKMLTQYSVMVQLYLFTTLMILLINAWEQQRNIPSIIIMEMLNLFFLAGLMFTFRLRDTNPYFMLEDTTYALDDGGNEFELAQLAVHGGVMSDDEAQDQFDVDDDNDEYTIACDRSGSTRVTATGTFEIGDMTDEEEEI